MNDLGEGLNEARRQQIASKLGGRVSLTQIKAHLQYELAAMRMLDYTLSGTGPLNAR
ncbi:MAG: hypothetical protein R3B96_22745 [Pirellulaceae bacterium]